MVSGALLSQRGAILPVLQSTGLSAQAIRPAAGAAPGKTLTGGLTGAARGSAQGSLPVGSSGWRRRIYRKGSTSARLRMPGRETGPGFRFHFFRFKFNFVIRGNQPKMAAKFSYSIVNEQGSKESYGTAHRTVQPTGRYINRGEVTTRRGAGAAYYL
jgi:hypothetical protein